jgi:hypothetical protein
MEFDADLAGASARGLETLVKMGERIGCLAVRGA